MVSDLDVWQVAAEPDIDVHRVPWPELGDLTRAVRALRDDTTPVAGRVTSAVWAARRILTSTPLPPSHTAVGVASLVDELRTFLVEHPAHTDAPALAAVRDAADALLASPSPINAWVGDVLSEYGAQRDGQPEAVLVVPRAVLAEPVRAWLADDGFTCLDIATPADLRRGRLHKAALVLGHPAVTYATPFSPPQTAEREVGWLLTSPPAHRVRLALLDDDPALKADELWVWPDAVAHPRLRLTVPDRTPATVTRIEWFTPAPVPAGTAARPSDHVDDPVDATAVVTASGHTVYFSPATGPRPAVLGLEDTGDVTISRVPITQLTVGRVLVEHTSNAARDELLARANQWLLSSRRWTQARIDATRTASLNLKFALMWALSERGEDGVVDALRKRGLDRPYARRLTDHVLDPDYIAPFTKGFTPLVNVLAETPFSDTDFIGPIRAAAHDLPTLRAAHQHAGELIHVDLRQRLRGRAWEDELTTTGYALVHDDTLGDVLLTTVLVVDGTHPVPRAWLGTPQPAHDRQEQQ
ncbi:hypothetical protein DDP54_07810 [Cellulomonas sp. WB94]|nr:hypothetical protein DDP54_07810 [Cellulomonas sp. WB94]